MTNENPPFEEIEYEFDSLKELTIEFTDRRTRIYWADSYSINSLMLHLYCKVGDKRKLVTMIPYMLVRNIEVTDQEVRGLIEARVVKKQKEKND